MEVIEDTEHGTGQVHRELRLDLLQLGHVTVTNLVFVGTNQTVMLGILHRLHMQIWPPLMLDTIRIYHHSNVS